MATVWPPYWKIFYFEDVIDKNQLDITQQSIQHAKISQHAKFYNSYMKTITPIEFSKRFLIYYSFFYIVNSSHKNNIASKITKSKGSVCFQPIFDIWGLIFIKSYFFLDKKTYIKYLKTINTHFFVSNLSICF